MAIRGTYRVPLTPVTVILVLVIAAVAAGGLYVVWQSQDLKAHAMATRTVLDLGHVIVGHLVEQPVVRQGEISQAGWEHFSDLVRSLYTLEGGLQYVSVSQDGVILFHEQMSGLAGVAGPPQMKRRPAVEPKAPIRVGRRLLVMGKETVPVVTFSVDLRGEDGRRRSLEIGLRKDTVEREETASVGATVAMFRLTLATVGVAFGVCTLLVAWLMHRETVREAQRREAEHLSFAGVMANGIVHDFRNPMSSLRLDIQMLYKEAHKGPDADPMRIASLTDRAKGTLDRMDHVFQEFFYLAKPGSEDVERIDVSACVRDCLEMLAPRFEQAGVGFEPRFPPHGPFAVVHSTSIRRALVNVLTNAEQHSKRGDLVDVEVGEEGGSALIDIMDKGPGIPKSDRRKVFDMFYSARPGGTGLGLFLAKTAIERSRGRITVRDRPGGGAWFRIALPLASEPRPGAGQAAWVEFCAEFRGFCSGLREGR